MVLTRNQQSMQTAGTAAEQIPSIKKLRAADRQARDSERVRMAVIQHNCLAARKAHDAAANARYLGIMRYLGKPPNPRMLSMHE